MYRIIQLIFIFTITAQFIHASTFNINSKTKIIQTDESKNTKTCCTILQKYIQKITGNRLEIAKNRHDTTNSILVGNLDSTLISANIITDKEPKYDGFISEITQNNILITAPTKRGMIYATYDLIEKMGVMFLSPDYEVIPHKSTIRLKATKIVSSPRFAYREIFIGESDDINYAIKNRLNGRLGHRAYKPIANYLGGSINTFNIFSPYKLLPPKKYKKDSPWIYCNGQINYANNHVKRLALDELTQKLSDNSLMQNANISITHQDNKHWCKSQKNKLLIKKYGSTSAPFILYAKYLADKLSDKFPNLKFVISAYQWSRTPPKVFPHLPSNTILSFSDIEGNFAKPINELENQEIYDDLINWSKLSDDIKIWHYITNFDNYLQPYPDLNALAENIKIYDSIKQIKGVFLQGSYGTQGGELSDLRNWVFSKLLWNPKLDLNELIQKFVKNYYKGASQEVLKYISMLNNSLEDSEDKLLVKTAINAKYLNDDFLSNAQKVLEKGLNKVKNTPALKMHMITLLSGIDSIRLLRGKDYQGREDAIKRFKEFVKYKHVKFYAEGKKIDELLKIIQLPRKKAKIPSVAKNNQWMDFQEYSLRLCCTKLLEDQEASDNIAAVISGNRSDWAFQLPINVSTLDDGEWDIYANIKIKLNEDISTFDKAKFAFFYGVKGASIKSGNLIYPIRDEKYHNIKLATIDTDDNDNYLLWIRPPKNDSVSKLYLDRVFLVKR